MRHHAYIFEVILTIWIHKFNSQLSYTPEYNNKINIVHLGNAVNQFKKGAEQNMTHICYR